MLTCSLCPTIAFAKLEREHLLFVSPLAHIIQRLCSPRLKETRILITRYFCSKIERQFDIGKIAIFVHVDSEGIGKLPFPNMTPYSLASHPNHGGDSVPKVIRSTLLQFAFLEKWKEMKNQSARIKHSVFSARRRECTHQFPRQVSMQMVPITQESVNLIRARSLHGGRATRAPCQQAG